MPGHCVKGFTSTTVLKSHSKPMEGDDYVHDIDEEMELRQVTWGTWGHTAGAWQCQCSNPGLSDSMPTPGVGRGIKRCRREDRTSAWQTFDNRLYLNPFKTSRAQTSKGCYSLNLGSRDAREENRRKQLLLREKSASIRTSKHRLSASVAGLELVLPWCSALKKDS